MTEEEYEEMKFRADNWDDLKTHLKDTVAFLKTNPQTKEIETAIFYYEEMQNIMFGFEVD